MEQRISLLNLGFLNTRNFTNMENLKSSVMQKECGFDSYSRHKFQTFHGLSASVIKSDHSFHFTFL